MDAHVLEARSRARSGRSGANASRREGFIPAVLYGRGHETQVIGVSAREFERLIRKEGAAVSLVKLALGSGEPALALIKQVQREPVSKDVVHIDFQSVMAGEAVEVAVPLTFVGEPQGVLDGGAPQFHRHDLQVSCLPANIPSGIEVDISGLAVHAHLTAGEIALPEGVSLAGDAEELIVAVTSATTAVAEEAAEDVAEEAAAEDADA